MQLQLHSLQSKVLIPSQYLLTVKCISINNLSRLNLLVLYSLNRLLIEYINVSITDIYNINCC